MEKLSDEDLPTWLLMYNPITKHFFIDPYFKGSMRFINREYEIAEVPDDETVLLCEFIEICDKELESKSLSGAEVAVMYRKFRESLAQTDGSNPAS